MTYSKQQGVTLTTPVNLEKLKETEKILANTVKKAKTIGDLMLHIEAVMYKKSIIL